MSWEIASDSDLNRIVKYLNSNESQVIQIYSSFLTNKGIKFPSKYEAIVLIDNLGCDINGIILISKRGIIYPRFEDRSQLVKDQLIKIMATIKVTIHGVVGLKEDVNFLDSIIFRRIRQVNNYYYYTHKNNHINITLENDIYKAKPKDYSSLLPLEIEYQREEVIVEESDLNKKAVGEALKRKLIDDDIYFIRDRNIIVSKAGTTFRSRNYVLLGGIFTWNPLRKKGLSTRLLNYLIMDQEKKGYTPALFVKVNNPGAIKLYSKVGFTNPVEYQINYYKR